MIFGSVCSGIEAASVAFEPLGWKAAWFAEIEPFPSAVLAHHYPDVPNLGDMTTVADRILSGEIPAPDLLIGGTPCQSFSVAGLRKSLADDRGNLALQFIRIANAIDDIRRDAGQSEAFILWENVPGVLSVQDNAFGTFLAGLCGCDDPLVSPNGTGWTDAGVVAGPERCAAWRICDAQHFGLAQRRRRVFVLARGGARSWDCADALLPIIESVRWNPPPSREAREAVAPTLAARTRGGGGLGTDAECDGGLIPSVSPTLRAGGNRTGGDRPPGTDVDTCETLIPVAHPLNDLDGVSHALNGKGTASGYMDAHVETYIGEPIPLRASGAAGANGAGVGEAGDPGFTLDTDGSAAVAAPLVFDETQITSPDNYSKPLPGDPSHPLAAGARPPTMAFNVYPASGQGADLEATVTDVSATVRSAERNGNRGTRVVSPEWAVRRLTVGECLKLQGFPPDYLDITFRGRPAADGPKYKATGNSFAVNVVRHIGEQIDRVRRINDEGLT